jgi:FMN phosphatase YigB (HAD superfamily)
MIPATASVEALRIDVLRDELSLSREAAIALAEDLQDRAGTAVVAQELSDGVAQRTGEVTLSALQAAGLEGRPGAEEIAIRAMSSFIVQEHELFEGAVELLETAQELGLRTVIVSNTFWLDARGLVRYFEEAGVGALIDHVTTSLDVGYRKPHAAMFDEGVRLAGCGAAKCAFVGNSEGKDIVPAAALGMRTIRVCIEDPVPERSRAEAIASDLREAERILRAWTRPVG